MAKNNELYHYGIPGMKWGVRRAPEQLGHEIKYKDKVSIKTKNGDTISLVKVPDSKFIKFLQRHIKSAAKEISKTANFQIESPNGKKIGDLQLYKEAQDSINVVWLGVNKKERGKGYATAVMKTAIKIANDTGCSKVTLEVPGNSPDARHVYEKLGFKEVSTPNINPDDIWGGLTNMELQLKPKSIKHSDGFLVQISDELKAAFLQELVFEIDRLEDSVEQKEPKTEENELHHHGILGQKWGVRHGPPYPLKGGQYSPGQVFKIRKKRQRGNKIYNKKHFDEVLSSKKTVLSTLSYDPNRTKNTDMFYATHNALDKHQYNALFNQKVPETIYDSNGKAIGTDYHLKFRINNRLKSDIKVASEDSGSEIFANLYKNDRDFYNFITDKSRMQSYFVDSKYKFKGYREAANALKSIRNPEKIPSESEVKAAYRMFNYVIPYDGAGDKRSGHDVAVQRAKFFKECKDRGYGAVLDTNDAIYGGFKAKSPVIVFDMEKIVPDSIKQTTYSEKQLSTLILLGRKVLGV